MKKKEVKKLKLNLMIFLSLFLMFALAFGLIFSINLLTTYIISKRPAVIAYKETASYLFIIIPGIILGGVGIIPYAALEKKYYGDKRKNQKIPKHRKPAKYENQFRTLKNGFIIFNILIILFAFPVCVNARRELHYDGIYKINLLGKEKLICPWDDILGFRIQVGKSRSGKSGTTHYYPEVVTITEKKDFYFPRYRNQICKKEFFIFLKDNPSVKIDSAELKRYYNKFTKDNQKLIDQLLSD